MNASLLAHPGLTESQTSHVNDWADKCEDQIVVMYMQQGMDVKSARKEFAHIQRHGLDEARKWPTPTDRAAFALRRYRHALAGGYSRSDALVLVSDAASCMTDQVLRYGAPALQLARTLTKLEAAMHLAVEALMDEASQVQA